MNRTYQVVISPQAEAAFKFAFRWIRNRAPQQAHAWAMGFCKAIESLEQQPARCQLAPEDPFFEMEIRQLLYGKRGHRYRALFTIEDNCVNVLFIRHYAQNWIIDTENKG